MRHYQHHFVPAQAATQAKEHLPTVLRARLLARDGREAPPLPAPPPPPAKPISTAEGDEELDEGYNDPCDDDEQGRNEAGTGSGKPAAGPGPAAADAAQAGPSGAAHGGARAESSGQQAGAEAAAAAEAGPPAVPLLPPPPLGPPLPPLLDAREQESQGALLKVGCRPRASVAGLRSYLCSSHPAGQACDLHTRSHATSPSRQSMP